MSEVSGFDAAQRAQELISRLPKVDSDSFRSALQPEYSRSNLALSLTPANLLRALHQAREARELAVSYRNFKVGAAAVALGAEPADFQIVVGANIKPEIDSVVNIHAEQVALQKAENRHYKAISLVAVVGDTQPDQQSGKDMVTLHPCGLCRLALYNSNLIDSEATLIASALPDFSKIELYTPKGLINFHEHHDESGINLVELPGIRADEQVWDEAVATFLSRHRGAILGGIEA